MPALTSSVPEARRRVVARLRAWGADDGVCDSVELVTSELFTNAVLHTDSVRISCDLRVIGSLVRVLVADEGCRRQGQAPDGSWEDGWEEGGRGLLLVATLAEDWGIHLDETSGGRITWAALPYEGGAPAP